MLEILSYAINHYWPVQSLYLLEDGSGNEMLRNLKNGICDVILLNGRIFLIFIRPDSSTNPKGVTSEDSKAL